MTEQRESDVPDGEAIRPEEPEAPRPDTGNWYPVGQPDVGPSEPAVPEEARAEPAYVPPVPQDTEEQPAPEVVEEPAAAEQPVPVAQAPQADERPAVPDEPQVNEQPEVANEPPEFSWRHDEPTVGVPAEPAEEVTTPVAVRQEDRSDAEPTAVVAPPAQTERLVIGDEPVAPAVVPAEAIFRPASPASDPGTEPTRLEPVSEEEQRLAAERAARREARTVALAAPAPTPLVAPPPVVIHKRTNDKFFGALGLFVLRIVVAGIMAIRGLNILTDIPAAQKQFAQTVIPEPGIMAIVTGVASELIALALLLGLLTRFAGLGVALIAGGALAFVYWGNWSPFVPGQPGFLGEFPLLLATVGLLLLLIGGGGWSLDRAFRAGRERDKRERSAAGQ